MLSDETIKKILGITEDYAVSSGSMVKSLTITFFPYDKEKINANILSFANKLKSRLETLGVKIIDYEEALVRLPFRKVIKIFFLAIYNSFLSTLNSLFVVFNFDFGITLKELKYMKFGKKIREGVSVIALGEQETGNMPMDFTMSFRKTSVIYILEMPDHINIESDFQSHFNTAFDLFTHHMANIVIAVDKEEWLVYNFNASHTRYPINTPFFDKYLLQSFIPKIVAPIRPPRLKDFTMERNAFDPNDKEHHLYVEDFIKGALLFDKTQLYPPGKKIDEMKFRNEYYKWIGKIHLDRRSGMSYGFLARQMKVFLPDLIPDDDKLVSSYLKDNEGFFIINNNLYIVLNLPEGRFCMPLPDTWVLTQRSGSDKTHIDPQKDLIKLGLRAGKMYLHSPMGLKITSSYKPSFDTGVILAHAIGNIIVGAIIKMRQPESQFVKNLENNGLAIAHWHGYINKDYLPNGWRVHGENNPHVPCSAPQCAYFALIGKLNSHLNNPLNQLYLGDIHVEPHHGINIVYPTLVDLGNFLLSNSEISSLGNKYLHID